MDIVPGAARIAHTLLEGTVAYPLEKSLPEADILARRADSMAVETAAVADNMAAETVDNTVVGKAVLDSLRCDYPSSLRFV